MKRILFVLLFLVPTSLAFSADTTEGQKEKSIEYFIEAAKVFQHPRCLNCHPAGDTPTQGRDFHAHIMNVQRGPHDDGAIAMKCSTCHGSENNLNSGVPGGPGWRLAPKSMAWQGLSKHQLCENIKDLKKNHGMTLEKLIHHNGEDKLVGWAWNPGNHREAVPGTQAQFGKVIAAWVGTGAYCP